VDADTAGGELCVTAGELSDSFDRSESSGAPTDEQFDDGTAASII